MSGPRAKIGWGLLMGLLALMAWVVNIGQTYVSGPSLELLENLAGAKELVRRKEAVSGYDVLVKLPLDSLQAAGLVQGTLVLVGLVVLWYSLYKVWANPVSPSLTTGLAFFGGSTLWFVTQSPGEAVAALFKAVGIAAIVAAKVPTLCAAVLVLGYLEPALGIALFLITIYLAVKRTESYGLGLIACALLGTGALLVVMAGDYSLRPALSGLSMWTVWPAVGVLLIKELRDARLQLYGVMLLASIATGSPELASIVCLGDLSLLALRPKQEENATKELPAGIRLSRPTLAYSLAFVVFILAVLPGEQYLNRQVLIPAQKKKIGIGRLFQPFSLATHMNRLGTEEWRQKTPFPQITQAEVELVKELSGPFRVLTLEQPIEDRKVGLLYALTAKQRLLGWDTPQHLSASSLICKKTGKNVIVDSEKILFRQQDEAPRLESGPISAEKAKTPDLSRAWEVPLQVQVLSEEPGFAYELSTLDSSDILFFETEPAIVVFSARPNVYTLRSLEDRKESKELKVNKIKLSLETPDLSEVLPSRSLVPLTFKLSNDGETAITTDELASVVLTVKHDKAYEVFRQEFPKKFVLFPKESIQVPLQLATPAPEGRFELTASVLTIDGLEHPLPLNGSTEIRTWRRLPPVGTWVEEPPTP